MPWIGSHRFLVIGLGFVALVLYVSQRSQTVYLWIFAVGAVVLAETPLLVISTFRNVSTNWEFLGALPRLVGPFIWVSLFLLRFCPAPRWMGVAHRLSPCGNR